jgi:hypothetical protein
MLSKTFDIFLVSGLLGGVRREVVEVVFGRSVSA